MIFLGFGGEESVQAKLPNEFNGKTGLQVGMYFIHHTSGEKYINYRGRAYTPYPWGVKHWPSDAHVAAFKKFDNALVLADWFSIELSIDPTNRDELIRNVPPELARWANYVIEADNKDEVPKSFRQWRIE